MAFSIFFLFSTCCIHHGYMIIIKHPCHRIHILYISHAHILLLLSLVPLEFLVNAGLLVVSVLDGAQYRNTNEIEMRDSHYITMHCIFDKRAWKQHFLRHCWVGGWIIKYIFLLSFQHAMSSPRGRD